MRIPKTYGLPRFTLNGDVEDVYGSRPVFDAGATQPWHFVLEAPSLPASIAGGELGALTVATAPLTSHPLRARWERVSPSLCELEAREPETATTPVGICSQQKM